MKDFFRFLFSKYSVINFFVAVVISVLLIYYLLNYLGNYTLHGQHVTVPDFSGFKLSEIDDFIKDKQLQYTISDSVYDFKKPRGTVIDQNPKAGTEVKENRKIYLTVNAIMPPRISLPDITDVTLRQAVAILESYGLKVSGTKYIPDQCVNCVLGVEKNGKKIEPGTMIEKNTSLELVLGQGLSNEVILVPDIKGISLQDAKKILSERVLNLLAVSIEDCKTPEDSAAAKIYKQTPEGNGTNTITIGGTINIWLSSNPLKKAEPDSIGSN